MNTGRDSESFFRVRNIQKLPRLPACEQSCGDVPRPCPVEYNFPADKFSLLLLENENVTRKYTERILFHNISRFIRHTPNIRQTLQ